MKHITTTTEVDTREQLLNRIRELELLVAALELDLLNSNPILNRKNLAVTLSCSERFLQSHQQFKSIERRIGKRVYYDWSEVKKLITENKFGGK